MKAWTGPVLLAGLFALGLFCLTVALKQPRHDRTWQEHLSRLPHISLEGDRFTISQYRDWSYRSDAPAARRWTKTPAYRLQDVRQAWFVVEPHPGLPVMAHTLVLFEFSDGDMIGLTVEARKQAGETYSALRGTFNAFELIYQWASPQDLLTRRAVMMDRELYLYRLNLSQGETEAYLKSLLEQTIAIEARPRFYNTAVSNCTNELAKSAGLAWDPAFILTGTADKALFGMNRIVGEGDFASVRQGARIDTRVRQIAGLPGKPFQAALTTGR